MDKLPFTKVFRDPGSVDGTSKIETSSPVPRREKPLAGTKRMTFPENDHMFGSEGVGPRPDTPSSRTAAVFGILAIACAVALIGLLWVANWPSGWGGSYYLLSQSAVKMVAFFLFGTTPVLAIMSRIVSDNRCRISSLVPVVLVVGFFLSIVVLDFLEGGK